MALDRGAGPQEREAEETSGDLMTLPLTPQASFALNLRGAGFMAVAMAGFACNDTLMKLIAPEIGLYQAILVRGIFATVLVGALVWRYGALAALVLVSGGVYAAAIVALGGVRVADLRAAIRRG